MAQRMRRLRSDTQHEYFRFVSSFATFLGQPPDTATAEDIRRFHVQQRQSEVQPPTINADSVLEAVQGRLHAAGPTAIRLVVCDLSASPFIDLAGSRILHELQAELDVHGIAMCVIGARGRVRDLLRADNLSGKIGGLDRIATLAGVLAGRETAKPGESKGALPSADVLQ